MRVKETQPPASEGPASRAVALDKPLFQTHPLSTSVPPRRKMGIGRQASTIHLPANLATNTIVLAGFQLPSLMSLVRTAPAYKHLLAGHTLHELDCSNKARHQIILRNCQQIASAISTLARITHVHAPHALANP